MFLTNPLSVTMVSFSSGKKPLGDIARDLFSTFSMCLSVQLSFTDVLVHQLSVYQLCVIQICLGARRPS